MALESIEYKRLGPSDSVSLVYDDSKKIKFWRYRYKIKDRGGILSQLKDYDFTAFKHINSFKEYIEQQDKPKGFYE